MKITIVITLAVIFLALLWTKIYEGYSLVMSGNLL